MKRILGFIFAILITVFAVMPNAYAEAQKNYGNLDMNRWVYAGSDTQNMDLLIDITSLDYSSSTTNKLICNLWVCYFYEDRSYSLQNLTIDYKDKSYTVDSIVVYDKNGNMDYSYTDPVPSKAKVVPSSMGEIIYYIAFPPEYIDTIKERVANQ